MRILCAALLVASMCSLPGAERAPQAPATAAPAGVALVSQSELAAELCAAPMENRAREEAAARLFIQAGAKESEVRFQPVDSSENAARNVYIVKPGRTADTIVVGGHLDHVAVGQGVIDDWSGVCATTNIYQAIKNVETRHTIVFIGFAGEESGLKGSLAYVESLDAQAKSRHKAMLNLECLGPAESHVWVNGSDQALIDVMRAVAAREKITLHEHLLHGVGADSNSFRAQGIPAVTIDGLPKEKFSLIHSEKDTCESVNQNYYYDSYRLAVSFLLELDRTAGGQPKSSGQ